MAGVHRVNLRWIPKLKSFSLSVDDEVGALPDLPCSACNPVLDTMPVGSKPCPLHGFVVVNDGFVGHLLLMLTSEQKLVSISVSDVTHHQQARP